MSSKVFSFPKKLRLRERRDFTRAAQKGIKLAGKYIYIDYIQTNLPLIRLGITATKKFGCAPERNRFKRLVREAFRTAKHRLPTGIDIVVKPRPYAKDAAMQTLQNEIEGLLINHAAKTGDP